MYRNPDCRRLRLLGAAIVACVSCAVLIPNVELAAQQPMPPVAYQKLGRYDGRRITPGTEEAALWNIAEIGGPVKGDIGEEAVAKVLAGRYSKDIIAAAWLALGDLYEKRGEKSQMVLCWQRAASRKVADPRYVKTYLVPQNEANRKLSAYFIGTSEWERALRAQCAYFPSDWCGTGLESQWEMYAGRRLELLVLTGRHELAVEYAWWILARYGNGSALVLTRL